MGRNVRRLGLSLALAGLVFVATACPVPPPGGGYVPPAGAKVIHTGTAAENTYPMAFSADGTTVAFRKIVLADVFSSGPPPYGPPLVYDDRSGATRVFDTGQSTMVESVDLSPDGRAMVFTSRDPDLQSGPVASNCRVWVGPSIYDVAPAPCYELYLVDMVSGARTQLTGVSGSSTSDILSPSFSLDGRSVFYDRLVWTESDRQYQTSRVDLETMAGEVVPEVGGQYPDVAGQYPIVSVDIVSADRSVRIELTSAPIPGEPAEDTDVDAVAIDVATGEVIDQFAAEYDVLRITDVSSDGRVVAMECETGHGPSACIFDRSTRELRWFFGQINPLISGDGTKYLGLVFGPGFLPDRLLIGEISLSNG